MYKDVFISYGRRESLNFVARLHEKLRQAGYSAWFDKIDIPDAERYDQRINHGIEAAHNFVYVMAPRSLTSPYCLIEIEYARVLGKRVIPLNHGVISATKHCELNADDKTVLAAFYKKYGLANPNLCTEQDVLDRSLKIAVGTTDWLEAQETITDEDCQAIATWGNAYENTWIKHLDPDYHIDLPSFGDAKSSLDSVMDNLIPVLEKHKHHVEQHTDILNQALSWQANQWAVHHLLVGKQRQAAQTWLLTPFEDEEQAPCQASTLMCHFICESRKNAENRMTDCFVCYVDEDKKICDAVVDTLAQHAITTWRDDSDISHSHDAWQAITQGVEGADSLLFFISPAAVQNKTCLDILAHAQTYNKRVIPLLVQTTPTENMPAELQGLHCLDFIDSHKPAVYANRIAKLLKSLRQEKSYLTTHKKLLISALRWQRHGQKKSFLLQGYNLEDAQTWLQLSENRDTYLPVDIQRQFIQVSEANKGKLGNEVFISYSRKDSDFARKLNLKLQTKGKTTWFDQESMAMGEEDFTLALYQGIRHSDNFVFILSPDSLSSKYCQSEVAYARSQNKRMLTLRQREFTEELPDTLARINWIDFVNEDFDQQFKELIKAIDIDRDYVHQHTLWQQRALEWQDNENNDDFLLNKSACQKAVLWQQQATDNQKKPSPTSLQVDYVKTSQAAIEANEQREKRRQRMILGSVTVGLIIALLLAGFAWIQMEAAQEQQQQALHNQSRFLADQAQQKIKQNHPISAMLIALEALPNSSESHPQRPLLDEAQVQLYNAVEQNWHGVLEYELNTAPNVFYDNPDQIIENAAFSSDGRYLLTQIAETIYFWDMQQHSLVHRLTKQEKGIRRFAFAANGLILETDSSKQRTYISNIHTEQRIPLIKHKTQISYAVFSPDAHSVFIASENSKNCLWDTQTGRLQTCLDGYDHPVTQAIFSSDGKTLATLSQNNLIHWWHLNTKRPPMPLKMNENYISLHTLASDGRLVLSDNMGNTRCFDMLTGTLKYVLKGHEKDITHSVFSPDEKMLLTTSWDKTARLWQAQTGELLQSFIGHESSVNHAAFSPTDSKKIITVSDDNTARLWDIQTGKLLYRIDAHRDNVRRVLFAPDGKTIVTVSEDNTARVWNEEGYYLYRFKKEQHRISHVTFSPDGKTFVTSDMHESYVWSINTNQALHRLEEIRFTIAENFESHYQAITHVAFSPDGKRLVTVYDFGATLWDIQTGARLHHLGHSALVSHATFSSDGKFLLTTSKTPELWDVQTGQWIRSFTNDKDDATIAYATFSPDSKTIVAASRSGDAILWHRETGKQLQKFMGHQAPLTKAIFSPNGKVLATASYDKTAALWNVQTGAHLHSLLGHQGGILDLEFSPDGDTLITTSKDNSARLWDTDTGEMLHHLKGHIQTVNHASFSHDGRLAITSSYDYKPHIWDIHTGRLLQKLKGRIGVFSPDDKRVITADDNTARLWPVFKDLDTLISETQTRLFYPRLSCAERKRYFLDFIPRCAEVLDETIRGEGYKGQTQQERAHGMGESIGYNHYQGQFKYGYKDGKGIYTWHTGEQLKGVFIEDAFQVTPHINLSVPKEANGWLAIADLQFLHTGIERPTLAEVNVEIIRAAIQMQAQFRAALIDARSNERLCYYGNISGLAAKMQFACDKAVHLRPDDIKYKKQRGMASALSGNYAGAIVDFQTYVNTIDETDAWNKQQKAMYQQWIETLKQGKNPITKDVLQTW